jgi:putative redox protein
MITIETLYSGGLRTEVKHLQSSVTLTTDAPVDNKGRGESFSPTDLLAASLGSCMLTIIGITADTQGFNIDGTRIKITKVMAANPRRVSEIHISFQFPGNNYTEKQREVIQRSALTCPVALSIHPDIKQMVEFNFDAHEH